MATLAGKLAVVTSGAAGKNFARVGRIARGVSDRSW
jgi:hypothetical protein